MTWLLRHDFLLLSLLFALPAAMAWGSRPDLRPALRTAALASLPFALTERYFYPDYWSPTFVLDLIHLIGFGLEDLVFVVSLGVLGAGAYPILFRRGLVPCGTHAGGRAQLRLASRVIAGLLALALGLYFLGVPMLMATLLSEGFITGTLVWRRRDLRLAALLGALAVATVYTVVCLIYAALLPGVFERVWHTNLLFHRTLSGVPLEELLYALASGALATVAGPFVRDERYVARATEQARSQPIGGPPSNRLR